MIKTSRKLNTVITYIATCLFWCSIYVYVPILSTYCETLGSSYTMIGTILSSYGLVQLILRIPIGVFSDKIAKRKVFMVFGLLISIVSGLVFFFGKTPTEMLIGRSLAGVSAATWAIFMINFGSLYPSSEQSKSMGIVGTTTFIGQVVATFFGGLIATSFSEKTTFIVSAFVGLLAAVLILLVSEKTTDNLIKPKMSDFFVMIKNKDLIYFSLLAVIMQIAVYSGVMGFIPNIIKDLGGNNIVLGLSSAFASLLSIPTSLLSGSFFENKVGFKVSLVASFSLVAIFLVLMGVTNSIPVILLLVLLTSAPRGVIQTMLNSLAIRGIKPSLRSAAASVFQSIYGLGMTIGPVLTGIIADNFGVTAAFIAVGIFTLLAVGILSFRKRWPEWVE